MICLSEKNEAAMQAEQLANQELSLCSGIVLFFVDYFSGPLASWKEVLM